MKYLSYICLVVLACHSEPVKHTQTPIEHQSADTSNVAATKDLVHRMDTTEWIEIFPSRGVFIDTRYATANNFVGEQIYPCSGCFIRRTAADRLRLVIQDLQKAGYGVKFFDCYRPHHAQKRLWEIKPDPAYVADPSQGSMHNRGLAVDITLVDSLGQELDMGTTFDFFGRRAHHDFYDLPDEVLNRRELLKSTMLRHGFKSIRTEWWHYSDTRSSAAVANDGWSCDR